jgi:hypothetical protein
MVKEPLVIPQMVWIDFIVVPDVRETFRAWYLAHPMTINRNGHWAVTIYHVGRGGERYAITRKINA